MRKLGFDKKSSPQTGSSGVDVAGLTARLDELKESIDRVEQEYRQSDSQMNANIDKLLAETSWQVINQATDFNTLTKTGKFYVRNAKNANSIINGYTYVLVDKPTDDRLTQTIWLDTNPSHRYTRVWYNNTWGAWLRDIDQTDFYAKLNSTLLGGKNYILKSQQAILNEQKTIDFEIDPYVDLGVIRQLTLSVDIYAVGLRKDPKAGAKWFRIGAEVLVTLNDNTQVWLNVWKTATDTATNHSGRFDGKYTVPTGKAIKSLTAMKIQIFDVLGTTLIVKNPKLEMGHIRTDYTPAPSDFGKITGGNSGSFGD